MILAGWIVPLLAMPDLARAQSGVSLETLSRRASEAMAAENYADAAKAFGQIVQLRPDLAEAHSNLGLALYLGNHAVEANEQFLKALELDPKLDRTRVLLGFSYFDLAQFDKAIEYLRSSFNPSATVDVLEHLALAYLRTDQSQRALEVLEAWRKKEPSNPDVLYHIGQTHTKLALETYETLKRAAPDSARLHQLQAELFEQQGHLEPAIAEYLSAIAKNPKMAGLRYELGRLLWENKRFDEAEYELAAELELSPNDAQTNYLLGNIDLQKQSLDAAGKYLRRAIELAPGHAAAHADLGVLCRLQGDNDAAEKELRRAAELAPDLENIHYMLFDLYRRMARREEAASELKMHQQLQKQSQARQRQPM